MTTTQLIITIVFLISYSFSLWMLFERSERKGWEALVPGYNIFVWLKILQKPTWWTILFIFPGVNVLMLCVLNVHTAVVFGKRTFLDSLFAVFAPFIFLPKLALDKEAKYVGPIDRSKELKSPLKEWGDAIVFAVVAASIIRTYFMEAFTIPTSSMEKSLLVGDYLFVSKMHYGPKIPNTPLSFPFAHHTLPATQIKSYLDWIKLPFFRLPGFQDVERNDVVVFNYPEGDTVVVSNQGQGYYQIIRTMAYNNLWAPDDRENKAKSDEHYYKIARLQLLSRAEITVRPVDKRENYIKRCVAIPGDVLEVKNAILHINGEPADVPHDFQYNYFVASKKVLNDRLLKEDLGISYQDQDPENSRWYPPLYFAYNALLNPEQVSSQFQNPGMLYRFPLTLESYEKLKNMPSVNFISPKVKVKQGFAKHRLNIFPNSPDVDWTEDRFGPLQVPEAGSSVELTVANLPFYERIIDLYEDNTLRVDGTDIYINDEISTSYTFKMNYYFMMGDNRHNSADSRFWGFVPEDHVVGKAVFVWMSLDPDLGWFDGKIRWDRVFSFID